MTALTGRVLHRIITICFLEGSLLTIMTGDTKGNVITLEKIGFIRAMGQVTGSAGLFANRLMHHLFFVILPFVALIADLFTLCFKKIAPLGCMGIVAAYALPFFQPRVHHGFVQPHFLYPMAGVASLVPRLFEQEFGHYAVSEMTILALLLPDHLMDTLHFHVFIGKLLVTIQTFLTNKGSFLGCRRTGGKINNRTQEN